VFPHLPRRRLIFLIPRLRGEIFHACLFRTDTMAARSLGDQRQQSGSPNAAAYHSEQNHLSPRWRVLNTTPTAPNQS